ncbi:MAG: zinc-binding alcohol dehydrogenase family protein [Candidatus Thioglobus sp.]|nr:zinc-binding alcohol dehydrogenase family protein [Candidatus Thioglobus pontius]MBL6977019.1 zinc-binding alcohol dehydrogenase family protein [Candidatus Thioglobus sp.]MBL6984849.1 zinc-binding alcohol dehydrogenase family protein [Candidatus Thioglobus sp.]
MQAIGYNGKSFVEFEHSLNKPQGRDLLIEVKAISINPIDSKVKQTVVDASSPKILGFDCAGVVRSVGDQVSFFKVGDEVYYAGDITRDGSNATHQLVDERIVALKPTTLDFSQAAALPLTSITAWESLFDRLKITQADKGKTLLLIGAAGGVGSMAIQFAKKVIGMNIVATASRAESKDWCIKMGVDVVLDHQNLAEQFKQQSLPNPDYILCMGVPDDYFESMLEIINPQGSICLLANAREPYDLNLLKAKSITLVWEMMFTRAMFQTDDMIEQHRLLNTVAQLVDEGVLMSPLTQCLSPISVETITQAHVLIEQGDMLGKLVIGSAD